MLIPYIGNIPAKRAGGERRWWLDGSGEEEGIPVVCQMRCLGASTFDLHLLAERCANLGFDL